MISPNENFRLIYPISLSIVLATILAYLVGYLYFTPYPGFDFETTSGTKIQVFDPAQADILKEDDAIIEINGLTVNDFLHDLNASYWEGLTAGDEVTIKVLRGAETQTVLWRFSGRTEAELNHRFLNHWLLVVGLGMLSVGAFLSIDPNNRLWVLLPLIYLLTALWVTLVIGAAKQHLWYSAYLVRVFGWLIAAIAVHVHWIFPSPFSGLPRWFDRFAIPAVYLISAVGIVASLLNPALLLYRIGMLSALTISIILISQHFLYQEDQRPRIYLVARFALLAIFPSLLIAMLKGFNLPLDDHTNIATIFTLPLFPTGYLFAILYGTHTRHHQKAKQLLVVYIFVAMIIVTVLLFADILENKQKAISSVEIIGLITLISLVSSLGFNAFNRAIEKYLLRPPQELPQALQSYTHILESTQDTASISSLLGSLILPALQIRQSVLVEIQSEQLTRILDTRGVIEEQIPNTEEILRLIKIHPLVIPPQKLRFLIPQKKWIRVVIPLRFDQELIGAWLLGHRDPNDQYEEHIVQALETIAQQTSIAIINHQKSTRLRSLYEANINRHEVERANLARELHDDTLNNLALLQREFKDPVLVGSLHSITTSLRKMIRGLRPEMLSYGLVTALQDLADTLNERKGQPLVEVDLEGDPIALPQNTELHIFRIVQQACENALEHAEANNIQIEGKIEKGAILLKVIDDGKGFDKGLPLNLTALIKEQHFGLAGMYERANFINAGLKVESTPGIGTTITLDWSEQD